MKAGNPLAVLDGVGNPAPALKLTGLPSVPFSDAVAPTIWGKRSISSLPATVTGQAQHRRRTGEAPVR